MSANDASPPRIDAPLEVDFAPQLRHAAIPVEVIEWSELLTRMPVRYIPQQQRARFNQLILCVNGNGTHHVDFTPVELRQGVMVRIRPGQVQRFEVPSKCEARMVIWNIESEAANPNAGPWYPGSDEPSVWALGPAESARVLDWVDELEYEQDRFDGSQRRADLMRAVLNTFLLMIDVELSGQSPFPDGLPRAYVDLREQLELDLLERPSVADIAKRMGYSTRTLDRACQQVSGQTAKQVIDERVSLEIRRYLADTSRSIAEVRVELGYDDTSNFSKFVRRHLGQTPADFRKQFA